MHSVPPAQARQTLPVPQMGLVAGQSGWPTHWMQLPWAPQKGVVGLAAAHSALPLQARQRPVARLQKGVIPEQWLLLVHSTHAPLVAPLCEQWGGNAAAVQSGSPVQARQLPAAQMGVPLEQCEFIVHD